MLNENLSKSSDNLFIQEHHHHIQINNFGTSSNSSNSGSGSSSSNYYIDIDTNMATPVKHLPNYQKLSVNPQINSSVPKNYFFIVLFLGSGVLNTLIVQLIFNNVAFNTKSMFTNLIIFSGYAFLHFVNDKPSPNSKKDSPNIQTTKSKTIAPWKFIVLSIFDCIASLLTTIGQIAIGSGLFQVIFSSKIVFSALLSRFYLKNPLSPNKWLSIILIFSGLCICVLNPNSFTSSASNASTTDGGGGDESSIVNYYFIFGCIAVLLAAFIFSSSHIFSEKMLKESDISAFSFASKYGIYSVIICLVYIFTVSFSNRKEWVLEPLEHSTNDQIYLVVCLLLVLLFTSFARASSVFKVLSTHGSVSLGVLYALQSIIVFFTSGYFLCDPYHPLKKNQCITFPKALGSLIVILGSLYYTMLSKNRPNQNNIIKLPPLKKLDFNKK